jgi:hypothetical protein
LCTSFNDKKLSVSLCVFHSLNFNGANAFLMVFWYDE